MHEKEYFRPKINVSFLFVWQNFTIFQKWIICEYAYKCQFSEEKLHILEQVEKSKHKKTKRIQRKTKSVKFSLIYYILFDVQKMTGPMNKTA